MLDKFISTKVLAGTVIIEFNKDDIIVFDITRKGKKYCNFYGL